MPLASPGHSTPAGNTGNNHRAVTVVMKLLGEGPAEGMTVTQLTALSHYARPTISVALAEARRAGLVEVVGTRPGASTIPNSPGQNVWRRTAAGQP